MPETEPTVALYNSLLWTSEMLRVVIAATSIIIAIELALVWGEPLQPDADLSRHWVRRIFRPGSDSLTGNAMYREQPDSSLSLPNPLRQAPLWRCRGWLFWWRLL